MNFDLKNTAKAKLEGDFMEVLGAKLKLPPVYKEAAKGAEELELSISPYAIVPGDDLCLKVSRIEKQGKENLAYLKNGDEYIFALVGDEVKEGDDYHFSILNEKVNVSAGGTEVLKATSEEEAFEGSFYKTEVKENGDRVLHFFYRIGGFDLEAEQDKGYKINSIDGNACYTNTYRYTVPRECIRLAEEGLEGKVTAVLDYGNVSFIAVETAAGNCLVKAEGKVGDSVKLAFDSKDVSVYSIEKDIKLC